MAFIRGQPPVIMAPLLPSSSWSRSWVTAPCLPLREQGPETQATEVKGRPVRFVTFKRDDEVGYGIARDGGVVLCGPTIGGPPTLKAALAEGPLERLQEATASRPIAFPLNEAELLPPIPDPVKIFCVGLNYVDHRDEASEPRVGFPTVFSRFADTQVGHDRPVARPKKCTELDYEGELAVVIGQPTYRVSPAAAMDAVAGYACYNDFSARDWQRHSSQWIPGKNFVGVGSFGPFLVTADEVPNPESLTLETRVNGETRQSASVSDMIFSIQEIVSYISSFSPLAAGDVIVTGTPGGVGMFCEPPAFLESGDLVEVEVSAVGLLRNQVVEEA